VTQIIKHQDPRITEGKGPSVTKAKFEFSLANVKTLLWIDGKLEKEYYNYDHSALTLDFIAECGLSENVKSYKLNFYPITQ
jgi:hypothetical protein